jgi:hypothetical protein
VCVGGGLCGPSATQQARPNVQLSKSLLRICCKEALAVAIALKAGLCSWYRLSFSLGPARNQQWLGLTAAAAYIPEDHASYLCILLTLAAAVAVLCLATGVTMAKLGGKVTVTDLAPNLPLLQQNCAANGELLACLSRAVLVVHCLGSAGGSCSTPCMSAVLRQGPVHACKRNTWKCSHCSRPALPLLRNQGD